MRDSFESWTGSVDDDDDDDVVLCMEKRLDCELEGLRVALVRLAGDDCGREGPGKCDARGTGVVP